MSIDGVRNEIGSGACPLNNNLVRAAKTQPRGEVPRGCGVEL